MVQPPSADARAVAHAALLSAEQVLAHTSDTPTPALATSTTWLHWATFACCSASKQDKQTSFTPAAWPLRTPELFAATTSALHPRPSPPTHPQHEPPISHPTSPTVKKKMSTPQTRSLYRRLLRELPRKPQTTRTAHQKLSAASPLQQHLRARFAQSPAADAAAASREAQADMFVQYAQAQRMYATLIERYNPGMGMSEEERVRLSARRIGMNLPVEFEAEDK